MVKKFTTELRIRLIAIPDKRIIPFFLISNLFEIIFDDIQKIVNDLGITIYDEAKEL